MEKVQFSELPISDKVKRAVADMGFEEATAIQTQSIPLILEGNDVIGHSQTGTGKTAAFGIPLIEKIEDAKKGMTQALILCPTRELAIQACEEIRKYAKYKEGIRVVPVYGGQPIDRQIRALRNGAEIVIGTPGRVMDHLRRRTLKLQRLTMIVLDEADEMLNMGFREDIETILKDVPEERQTILFSATMPQAIMNITREYQKDPKLIKVIRRELTVPNIKQYCYECRSGQKIDALGRLLDYNNPSRAFVFCNTKRMVDELVNELQSRGYSAAGLHGDMKQATRTTVMNVFKKGNTDILVATDVAARGIDVDDVEAIFNFDIPQDEEYYIHRIGRTGRAGKSGTAHTLVSGRKQIYALRDIQRYTKTKIEMLPLPSLDDVDEIKNDKMMNKLTEILEEKAFQKYEILVDQLMEKDFTSVEIACAVMQMLSNNSSSEHSQRQSGQAAVSDIKKAVISRVNSNTKKPDRDWAPKRKSASRDTRDNRDNRDNREPRVPREPREQPKGPLTRLILNIGKKDRIGANHIVAAIAGESGIQGKMIHNIEINRNYSFADVPSDKADLVIKAMKDCVINGRPSTTEAVKKRRKANK